MQKSSKLCLYGAKLNCTSTALWTLSNNRYRPKETFRMDTTSKNNVSFCCWLCDTLCHMQNGRRHWTDTSSTILGGAVASRRLHFAVSSSSFPFRRSIVLWTHAKNICDTRNTSLSLDKELNIFLYWTPCCVIYRSYALLNMVRFLDDPVDTDCCSLCYESRRSMLE